MDSVCPHPRHVIRCPLGRRDSAPTRPTRRLVDFAECVKSDKLVGSRVRRVGSLLPTSAPGDELLEAQGGRACFVTLQGGYC